jgi:hypothetical protein
VEETTEENGDQEEEKERNPAVSWKQCKQFASPISLHKCSQYL